MNTAIDIITLFSVFSVIIVVVGAVSWHSVTGQWSGFWRAYFD